LESGVAKPPLQSPNPSADPASSANRERRERVTSPIHSKAPEPGVREHRERVRSGPKSLSGTSANRERRERVRSSSGPKTPEGKAHSSQNAVTHGLRATKLENAVAPTLRAEYEKLRQQYLDEYKPSGAIESTLVDMVIFAAWQLYKIREMELWTDIDLGAPGSFGRSEKLARYCGSHERLLFRSLNQLRQIQQERALSTTDRTAALPAHLAPAVRLKPLFAHVKSLSKHPKTLSTSATTQQRPVSRIRISSNVRPRGPVNVA